MNETGKRIVELLDKRGMTRKELAQKAGVTQAAISRYTKGNRSPKWEVIVRIADALNTTTDYLLGTEKKMDFNAKYYEIRSLLKRNTHYMTNAQKVELISAILEIDN